MNQEGNNTPHQIPSNRSIVLQVPVLPQTPHHFKLPIASKVSSFVDDYVIKKKGKVSFLHKLLSVRLLLLVSFALLVISVCLINYFISVNRYEYRLLLQSIFLIIYAVYKKLPVHYQTRFWIMLYYMQLQKLNHYSQFLMQW